MFYPLLENDRASTAESKFLVSGSADNTLRLWSVATGKCLYTWEFQTAVKRVAFNEDDTQVVCITEQRMGYQCAIRVFDINREGDGTNRTSIHFHIFAVSELFAQNRKNPSTSSTPSAAKRPSAPSR